MITQYSWGHNIGPNPKNNVKDMYKMMWAEEVRASLAPHRLPLVTIYQNLAHDYNKSSAVRSGNAFLQKESYFFGYKHYDSRGCVGTNHLENVYHADTFDEVFDLLKEQGYTIYAVDNIMEYNPKNLFDITFPPLTALVFGEENAGLSKDVIDKCDDMIYINTPGSVRSMNVACSASILMYEYSKQMYMRGAGNVEI